MWVREVEWMEPVEAARRFGGLPSLALLDSAMAHPTLGRFSYLAADPFAVFTVRDGRAFWNGCAEGEPPIPALRRRLRAFAEQSRRSDLPPFQGGAIGFFGYDFGWSLEGRPVPQGAGEEDVRFAFYDVILAFDHVARTCRLVASGRPEIEPAPRRRRAKARFDMFARRLADAAPQRVVPPLVAEWRTDMSRDAYRAGIERVKRYIRDGDIYQANIAQRFTAAMPPTDAFDLYRAVRAKNPAPFAAYLDCGARHILSTSPELFLRSDGAHVETRPIKGTVRRPDDPVADAAAAARLLSSRKDRAENVMIVDLLRNDLARVCRPTSVEAPVVCGLESYAGLHHLVSSVTGELAPGRDTLDLVAATFPGGSITGAPKIRAMEIIAEIERRPRGVYCGAIGWLGFDGALDLNIAIRTIVAEHDRLDLCAGGGITILSDADAEYAETFVKARRILDAFVAEPAEAET